MSDLANSEDEATRTPTDEPIVSREEGRRAGFDLEKLRAELTRDNRVQGLTPAQIDLLARKVYNLLRYELMLERERGGRRR